MTRTDRIQSLTLLLTYVTAWALGPFVVQCVESDGSAHFEHALADCCVAEAVAEDLAAPDPQPQATISGNPGSGDCAGCTHYATSESAQRVTRAAVLEGLDAALAHPVSAPAPAWLALAQSRCAAWSGGLPLPREFLRHGDASSARSCVLLI